MAFLMTPPTRATLPVAEMSSVRTHTKGMLLRHRRQLVLVVSLHALAAVAALAAPRIVGLLVDTVTQQGDVATVDRLGVGLAVAVVAQTVLTWFARRSSFRMGEDLFAELREQFMDRVVSLPLSTVERAGTGDLVSRTTNDVEALSHVARFGIPSIFVAVVTVVITCIAAFLTGWMVALAIVVGFPLLWLSTRWYLRYAPRRLPARTGHLRGDATASSPSRSTAPAPWTRCAWAVGGGPGSTTPCSDAYDAEMYTLRPADVVVPQVEIAYLSARRRHAALGRLAGRRRATTTVGTVTAVALYVRQLAMPLDELLMLARRDPGGRHLARPGHRRSPTCRRTGRRAGRRRATAGSRSRTSGMRTGPVATCSTASRSTCVPGERLAIVGPSGAGKSTLGRLMAGIDGPRAGRVDVGGVRLVDLELDQLRGEVALVTQEHHVFVGTLEDNLRLARPGCDAGRAARRPRGGRRAGVGAGAARAGWRRSSARGARAHRAAGAAARAGPAGARRPAYPRARRGHLAAGPARGAAPRAVAWPPSSRDVRSSPSRTVCTRRTTPTGWPWSRRASSPSSAPTTS